ncbi:hypothetical protein QUF76_14060 [Desulfobacterales bacterium HSG16]|nr:hypothetical protein [Desulfobacterales bacterium HSG16]
MIIQIYEIQTREEARSMIELGVDHIGSVILSKDDWKSATIKDSIEYVADNPAKSSLIPLYNHADTIFYTLEYYKPDIVHFCEDLSTLLSTQEEIDRLMDLQKQVKKRFPQIAIMRSIPIALPGLSNEVNSIEIARIFEPVSDFFLTDTLLTVPEKKKTGEKKAGEEKTGEKKTDLQQPVSGFVGITGQICDWDMAKKLVETTQIPVILAGGLSPENVFQGIEKIGPAGVDSCTATNAVDKHGKPIRFKKDLKKVKSFVNAARSLDF